MCSVLSTSFVRKRYHLITDPDVLYIDTAGFYEDKIEKLNSLDLLFLYFYTTIIIPHIIYVKTFFTNTKILKK